jgi:hypothetical protein
VYDRAELHAQRVLYARLSSRAKQSESYWVLIEFHHPYVPTIASIQYFFTLRNTPNASGRCGTFYAVVRLYRA